MVTDLTSTLESTWKMQEEEGFLLSDPAGVEERTLPDPLVGISWRLRWMPHRELRANAAELERRGILNPDRRHEILIRDPRDPSGRHCFLCKQNIVECNPMERLIPVRLAGRDFLIGANFAWIERNHFTVMAAEHVDQDFAPDVIDAMVDLYRQTEGMFRVLYNGPQAGATIPWHLHYQITTERFPVEDLAHESAYPTVLWRVDAGEAAATAGAWIEPDPEHRRVNVLVAGDIDHPTVYVFARDRRQARADSKGLMGGFEICGDLIFSEPDTRSIFETASFETARQAITEVRPEGV